MVFCFYIKKNIFLTILFSISLNGSSFNDKDLQLNSVSLVNPLPFKSGDERANEQLDFLKKIAYSSENIEPADIFENTTIIGRQLPNLLTHDPSYDTGMDQVVAYNFWLNCPYQLEEKELLINNVKRYFLQEIDTYTKTSLQYCLTRLSAF